MSDYKPDPVYVDLHRAWEDAEKQVQSKLENLCEAYRQLGELQNSTERRRYELEDAIGSASLNRIKMHDYANDVRKKGEKNE